MIRVRYVGSREWLVTTGLNRKEYSFNKENDYTVEVENEKEATKLLSSAIHRFVILPEIKPEEILIPKDKPVVKVKEELVKPKKKRRKE